MSEKKKSSSSSDPPRNLSCYNSLDNDKIEFDKLQTSVDCKNKSGDDTWNGQARRGPSVYSHKNCERVCDQTVRPLRHFCNSAQRDNFMKQEEKTVKNKKSRYPELTEDDEEQSFQELVERMKIGQPEREELAKAMGFATSSSQK